MELASIFLNLGWKGGNSHTLKRYIGVPFPQSLYPLFLLGSYLRPIPILKDPTDGSDMIKVHRREDIYNGDYVKNAPDLLFEMERGYAASPTIEPVGTIRKENYSQKPKKGETVADHTIADGLLMIQDERVKSRMEKVNKLGIADVGRVTLSLFNEV